MIKLFFFLLSFSIATDILSLGDNSESDPLINTSAKKKEDKKKPSPKSFAWYVPTACMAGLLLNNQVSFKMIPTCIGILVGIGGGFAGQHYLDKNRTLNTGFDGEKEEKGRNFRIGTFLKSIGWVSTVVAFNGIANYITKTPLLFNGVQALDKLIITPGFFNTTPEFAQLCQNNHLAAAGMAMLSVGLVSNYFLSFNNINIIK